MDFATVEEAFGYIEGFTNFERITPQYVRDFKQSRMKELLELAGNPERDLTCVHIAGSKGKGSTAAFVSSVFTAAGIPAGAYTSPHVASYRERITLGGSFFPDEVYINAVSNLRKSLESKESPFLAGEYEPTTFELLTVLAFSMFAYAGCSWCVIETGIGGRLDATNVISPAFCILTPVELEHTDILGFTIEEIAAEKAGIIKPGVPVFCSRQQPAAEAVFRSTAEAAGAPITFLYDELAGPGGNSGIGFEGGTNRLSVRWKDGETTEAVLAMPGRHQAENAALAALAVRTVLPELKPFIPAGLGAASIPGRMELRGSAPPFVFDGAHTPSSVKVLIDTLEELFPQSSDQAVLIFGSVDGKDSAGMAKILAPRFAYIIISTPGKFKKSSPEAVYETFSEISPKVRLVKDPAEALKEAYSAADRLGGPVCVTGSFYMVAEIRGRVD